LSPQHRLPEHLSVQHETEREEPADEPGTALMKGRLREPAEAVSQGTAADAADAVEGVLGQRDSGLSPRNLPLLPNGHFQVRKL